MSNQVISGYNSAKPKNSNPVIEQGFGAFVVTFGVIMSFLAIVIYQNFQSAKESFTDEGGAVNSIIGTAAALPAALGTERVLIIAAAKAYAGSVICDELPYLACGKYTCHEIPSITCCKKQKYYGSVATLALYDALALKINALAVHIGADAQGQQVSAQYAALMESLKVVETSKNRRNYDAARPTPDYIIYLLLFGFIVVVMFPLFLTGSWVAKLMITLALFFVFGFVFFIIYLFNEPYSGHIKINVNDYPMLFT